jgi:hypothetical protein
MELVTTHAAIVPRRVDTNDAYDAYLADANEHTITIHQFTSPRCKRCGTVKQQIGERLKDCENTQWIITDVLESDELQQRFDVTKLPRVDVSRAGRTIASLEAFDATIERIVEALDAANEPPPPLILDEEF